MGFIEEFGYKILRLKDERAEHEYVLYNIETKDYSFLSEKRISSILLDELKIKNIDLAYFIHKNLGYDLKNCDPIKFIKKWIPEELILVNNIGFKPVDKIIYKKEGKVFFNTYQKLPTLDKQNYILEKPMSFDKFKEKCPYHYKLFYNLHNKDDIAIQDTLMKIADKIKYPELKSQDCIVFYPGEGAGKGIFYKHVLQPIFGKYAKKVLMKSLKNDFNGFLKEPLILVLEEGKRDLELVEITKEITTESSILINDKGISQKQQDIYFLTFVFSNHMNPIDLGKRRGSYHLTHSLGKTISQSQDIGAEICENIENETKDFLLYLHNLEFTHQEAMKPFNTKAKEQVTDLNKTPIELFYDYLITFDSVEKGLRELHNKRGLAMDFEFMPEIIKRKNGEEDIFISKDMFKDAYNNFCYLEGLKSNIIRHNKDIVQLWALMKIPEESHLRITVKYGKNEGRKIDHVRLRDVIEHIKEVKEYEDNL